MSEEKDRASSDIEMISRTDKNEENRSKSEDGMMIAHSETAMLEDEEMPTYISVSTSSKCEDSDVSNTKQHDEESPTKEELRSPCTSEPGGTSSVYSLSSGEDTDPRYHDEDDGDYGDTDEMEDIDHESEHDNALMDEEEQIEEQIEERNCEDVRGTDVEEMKPTKTNKVVLKDYAERVIKDFEIEEAYTNSKNIYMTPISENGEVENKPLIDYRNKRDIRSTEMDIREKEFLNSEEKKKKRNGSVKINMLNHAYSQANLQRNAKLTDQNEHVVNGHQLTLFNLRTLSYDEYMHGNANYNQDGQLNKNMHVEEHENNDVQAYSEIDVMNAGEADNSNPPCSLKIENVKSIRTISEESKDNTENLKFEKMNEDTNKTNAESIQITLLKNQLDQKTMQFNNLKDAYQNTIAENIKMKEELELMKMYLADLDKEQKVRETKVAAVQTDLIEGSVLQQNETAGTKETGNKVSSSSIASVASTINQWTDSAGSSGTSIKPPDLGTILNSEDSLIVTDDTPRKINHPLSRAFVTSSRILQTLSNITQGKSKSEIKSNSHIVRQKKRPNENEESEHAKKNDGSIIAGSNAFTTNSPSNSKKRKATEMLGSTFLQPSKMPYTAELKRKLSAASDFNGDFKQPDNYNDVRLDAQKSRINNISRSASPTTVENKNDKDEDIDVDGNVKCFIYQEDENLENRSILIQAAIPSNDQESVDMGCIRECGPYLLGNLEVRMSEINGTINIWGKELSQTSIDNENEEEVEDEEEEKEEEIEVSTRSHGVNNKCTCLQNTPHRKFNGSKIVCSTNKKGKIPPKFSNDHNCQYLHVPDKCNPKIHVDNLLSPSISASCGRCISLNNHKECSIDKRHTNFHETSHSCCVHHIEHLERDYRYACDCERRKSNNGSPCCAKEGSCTETLKKFPSKNVSDFRKDFYSIISPTVDAKEVICKHRTTCRRSSLHNTEANFQNDMKCCNSIKEASHACKSTLGSMGNQDNGVDHCCNHSPTNNDEELLIPERCSNETPEIRQRRSSGKKVRGILMDLLKSCGDYRNSSSSSSKKFTSVKEPSHSVNCSPQIHVTSCNSPDVGCSTSQQSTGRCCHAYARRIESQLEEFRKEMERVRTRSDAILNLINMLHSVEMN